MISHIRIERFKCFEDVSITFGKITLFAGNNGTGKSTALQVLLLLRQAFILGSLKNNELPLNGEIIKIGTAKDALFASAQEDSIALTISFGENPNQEIRWVFDSETENRAQYFMRGVSSGGDMPLSGPFASRFSYLMAERLGPRVIYPIAEIPDIQMHVGFQGEYTAHCLAKFGDKPIPNSKLALEIDAGAKNLSLANQTQLWMRKIIPGVAFNVEAITKADMIRLEVKIYGEQTEYLRPTNMGFGVCYTLPIIVAGLMAEPDTMLIIENPEAHLHPAGQSQIAQFLAKVAENGVQVVVETHSDHILNGIRISVKRNIIDHEDVHIQFFGRGKGLGSNIVEKPRIFKDGGIGHWPEGFFDQFERDLEELF